MRKLSVLLIIGSIGIWAGCGGSGGGTPSGIPTSVVLSPSAGQSISAGGSLSITASVTTGSSSSTNVTWSLSGPGSLSSTTANPVTYTAPTSASSNATVVVTATSVANTGSTAYIPLTVIPAGSAATANTVAAIVDGGPVPPYPNGVFTSVNICSPGTTTCQTVDHILVDTGSSGLRILQSVLSSSVSLPPLTDTNNNPIFNCVAFLDGSYLWGPVSASDLRLNGEVSGSALVQVISSSNSGIPNGCTNGGTVNENTAALLGANGILGIGLEPTDCSLAGENLCDGSVQGAPPVYWSCPNSSCGTNDSPITIPGADQVVNPVVLFAADNNGDVVTFPSLGASNMAATASGTITFGIGTQTNNALGSATIYTLNTGDSFTTLFQGQTLIASFLDSGSNAWSFPSSLVVCTDNTTFYCPTGATGDGLVAVNNDVQPGITFEIDNADTLFATNDNAFATLGSPLGSPNTCSNGNGSCSFDFGFPFFYGRKVFNAIDGQNVPSQAAPWFAY